MTRINPDLKLLCHICGWEPGEDQEMRVVRQHFSDHHPDDKIKLDLSAFCTCGKEMTFIRSEPSAGAFRDLFRCTACGNEGYIRREPK